MGTVTTKVQRADFQNQLFPFYKTMSYPSYQSCSAFVISHYRGSHVAGEMH